MCEIWNKRREQLEAAVKKAALDLFEHTDSCTFKIPLDNDDVDLFVIAGASKDLERFL